ncbi:DUF1499 domain-containing protein [Pontixanthobacter aquaemixtae]|uniref:DUF1499 domain-containing protein n=1 Tax=Pontixanthobacter aquaemixtae TaxID=1958940 RepID=A0A844ZT84_9SPHN|nr:DUF1499 domain-containing protein [Pontixanthobacter aquaemixtae]MXO90684.1 DUF1499 domain-containing protein [Pontixanthobacter aquaemixtae]
MNIVRKLPRIALLLAILLIVWFAIAMFGAKFGVIDKLFAFGTMTAAIGSMAAMVIAGIALIALLVALLVKPRQGILAALVALLIPAAVLLGFNQLRATAGSVPFIYDITTNTADAPQFSDAMVKARANDGANDLLDFNRPLGEYEKWADQEGLTGITAAQLIADGYPDLKTLNTSDSVEDAMSAVQSAMEMRGFDNVKTYKDEGIVEGTDEVFWYGFLDDVVVRVRETEEGTAIDFRSTSRLGTSDLGVNAKRIADLRKAVEDRLTAMERKPEAVLEETPDTEESAEDGAEDSDGEPAAAPAQN